MKYCQLLILFVLLTVFATFNVEACSLKFRSYYYPPFSEKTPQGDWIGLEQDYAKAITAAIGCDYTVVEAPWARGIDMLKNGEVDFMLEVSKTADREPYLHYVGPQRIEYIYLVTRKQNMPLVTQWQQLQHLEAVLMRQKGAYLGERFERVLKTNQKLSSRFVELPNSDVRLDLLEKGRIDGFLVDSVYISYMLDTQPKAKLVKVHPLIIHQNPVYFAFSKATVDEKMVKRFEQAYLELEKSGALKDISKRYSFGE